MYMLYGKPTKFELITDQIGPERICLLSYMYHTPVSTDNVISDRFKT